MRRRELLMALGVTATWPLAARAQQPSKLKRVAMFHPTMDPSEMRIGGDPTYAIIFDEMKRLGRSEGINLFVDRYSAEGRSDDLWRNFQRIAATQPDAILTMGPTAAVKLLPSEASCS
jgi:hypothetical protein